MTTSFVICNYVPPPGAYKHYGGTTAFEIYSLKSSSVLLFLDLIFYVDYNNI